jgi:hypothetical protein
MTAQLAFLASKTTRPGLLDTMPPWALVLIGIGLLAICGVMHVVGEKHEDIPFLDMGKFVCGLFGVLALFQGFFGG